MKKRKLTNPTALMLMLLAVVCTFNITFFVATDYYNTRLEELEEMETRYSNIDKCALALAERLPDKAIVMTQCFAFGSATDRTSLRRGAGGSLIVMILPRGIG